MRTSTDPRAVDRILVRGGLCALIALTTFPCPSSLAEDLVLVPRLSAWSYLRGLQEASTPDLGAWRQLDFDDGGWSLGDGAFGYGDPPYGTDLSAQEPPMRGAYMCIFLRRTFEVVDDLESLIHYELRGDYDDGFIAWINGVEVLRVGMRGSVGDEVTIDDDARRSHESGSYETFLLPDPAEYLVPGVNMLAVQAFNTSLSNTDFKIDVELVDPFGPDRTPPRSVVVVPSSGTTVRSLRQIEVTFNEPVTGIDAVDLRVGGRRAMRVLGLDAGPYVFTFDEPVPGRVVVEWVADHGITDFAEKPNALETQPWVYTLDPQAPLPDLVISELLASNRGDLDDEDGDSTDWIEIHNDGESVIDLVGYSLSDERSVPGQWVFPRVLLEPDARLVVFASGKNRRDAADELHTSFRLDAGGEYLGLFAPESPRVPVREFDEFPEQRSDYSYGVTEDGRLGYFAETTPGSANSQVVLADFVEDLRFSVERGIYDEAQTLEITTATPDATILYTLDGSEPGVGSGEVYDGPIVIAGTPSRATVTLKAVAVRDGFLPSGVETHSYVFPVHVLTQPNNPAGFPTRWGAAPAVDYEVDPQIVNDERYTDLLLEGLVDLPTVSIVATIADIFGSRGIYSNSTGEGVAWERPCSAELIHPDGSDGFQIDCGVRILGGASRDPSKSPKHSFRLLFKGDYGPTRLRYDLFGDSDVDSFDTLVLRANYNNSWIHWDSGQRGRGMMVRDQWLKDCLRDMGQETTHGSFVNLYVNGLYWGVYNLVERPSAPFAADHMGGEKEEYDALNSGQAVDGDLRAWNSMLSAVRGVGSDNARFLALRDHLDVDNLIDYMIANYYGANHDWDNHNWYSARRRIDGGQWRFFSWDAERILEGISDNRTNERQSGKPTDVHHTLRANQEYRVAFGDRVHRHLFGSGSLTPDAATARFLARTDEVDRAAVSESARWGDYRRDVHSSRNGPYEFYRHDTHWLREKQRLLTTYFPRRTQALLASLERVGLYPRVDAPVFSDNGGIIDGALELAMTLEEGQDGIIVYTLDGSDPRVFGSGEVSGSAMEYAEPIRLTQYVVVKARTLDGEVWSALQEAVFTRPAVFERLHVSEIMYHPMDGRAFEFIELHNAGDETIDLSGVTIGGAVELTFAPGASIAAGAHVVVVADVAVFSTLYPDVSVAGAFRGSLGNGGEKITVRDAEGRRIVSVEYDDEGFWPLEADGFGRSLVLDDLDRDPDDPRAWRGSTLALGSPGAADGPRLAGEVRIHEIVDTSDPTSSGIELHGSGDRAVELGGWFLSDSRQNVASLRKFVLPGDSSVSPGGFLWVAEFDLIGAFALDPGGGEVFLSAFDEDGLASRIVVARYRPTIPGTSSGVHETSTGLVFTVLGDPTPGAENSEPFVSDVVINEIMYHPVSVAPGVDGVEWLELHNQGADDRRLFVDRLASGWVLDGLRSPDDSGDFAFPEAATVSAGGFLLLVASDPEVFRAMHEVPDATPIVGPFGGGLANDGERLALRLPLGDDVSNVVFAELDGVRYNDRAPWPVEPDGAGPSLERRRAEGYGGEIESWGASTVDGGSPGRSNTLSVPPQGGRRLPGDINEDGALNLTDAVNVLGLLFQGDARVLPCGDGTIEAPANVRLLDANGDSDVNLSDAVSLLNHLFSGGPPHALGSACVEIEACSDRCEGP